MDSTQNNNLNFSTDIESLTREINFDILAETLDTTIKHDTTNKVITFLVCLLTYTEEDQLSITFTAESCSGKTYIPLEIIWYFPKEDVIELGYCSPSAFFHEWGRMQKEEEGEKTEEEEEEPPSFILVDLHQKMIVFLDQPHFDLLQRLRPLLSHDRQELKQKITDRTSRFGLRTKNVTLRGFPTVIFCSASYLSEEQERTRHIILSPETSQEKLRETIKLRIEKDSDRESFRKYMESHPARKWLKARVVLIKAKKIKQVIIPQELQEKIEEVFFKAHEILIPRHQRDIGRLLSFIKGFALLNCFTRQKVGDSIVATREDLFNAVRVYQTIFLPNELGLSPEIYEVFKVFSEQFGTLGVKKAVLQSTYFQTFGRPINNYRLKKILDLLVEVGLAWSEADPLDKRRQIWFFNAVIECNLNLLKDI